MKPLLVSWSYPESVLGFDDGAVEDGGLCILGDAYDLSDILTCGRRNGRTHFFYKVFGAAITSALCKKAMLSVHSVLRLDLTR